MKKDNNRQLGTTLKKLISSSRPLETAMPKRTSRLSGRKINQIIEHFAYGADARSTAKWIKVNRNTVNQWYLRLRELISKNEDNQIPQFSGKVEMDHAYFGGKHTREGMCGDTWAANKIIVFGIYDRKLNGGTLYVEIVPDTKTATLLPIIKRHVKRGSYIYTDEWRGFKCLSEHGYKHRTVNHSKEEYCNRRTKAHTGHVDSFWGIAKKRYRKLNGIPHHTFPFFLKECQFRYNHRGLKDKVPQEGEAIELLIRQMLKDQLRNRRHA